LEEEDPTFSDFLRLIATFSDSTCSQSKLQTMKATQNKFISKILVRVFFFF